MNVRINTAKFFRILQSDVVEKAYSNWKAVALRKNGARLAQMVRGLDLVKVIGCVNKGIQPGNSSVLL